MLEEMAFFLAIVGFGLFFAGAWGLVEGLMGGGKTNARHRR